MREREREREKEKERERERERCCLHALQDYISQREHMSLMEQELKELICYAAPQIKNPPPRACVCIPCKQ